MRKNRVAQIIIIAISCLLFGQQAFAAIGSSSGYSLEVADIVNQGTTGTSTNYGFTGVMGDSFDSNSESTNYKVCAGFVEEALGDCLVTVIPPVTPPTPPPPPPSGGSSGGSSWHYTEREIIYEAVPEDIPETEAIPEPEPPLTPPAPPSVPGPLQIGEDLFIQPSITIQPGIVIQPSTFQSFADAPITIELRQNSWCRQNACIGPPFTAVLRASASESLATETSYETSYEKTVDVFPLITLLILNSLTFLLWRYKER